jgi:hypothetical protein
MAEKQAGTLTKSILLSGGMQDDVSTFHQADPACAYIENGRFRKKDEIEKRLPHVQLEDTGLPFGYVSDGNPLMLAEQGDTLVTMDKDGTLYTLDASDAAATWSSKTTNITPYNAEVAYQSAPEPNAACFDAITTDDFKVMAWEVREHGTIKYTLGAPQTSVIVEVRKNNGDLIQRWKSEGSRHPRLVNTAQDGSGSTYVCYQYHTGDIYYRYIDVTGLSSNTNTGITAVLDNPIIAKLEAAFDPDDAAVGTFLREDGRIGLCNDGGLDGMWDFGMQSLLGAYTWTDGTNLRMQFSLGPLPWGAVATIATAGASGAVVPYAVSTYYSGSEYRAGVLLGIHNATDAHGDLWFAEYRWDTGTATPIQTDMFALGAAGYASYARPVNAAIHRDEDNDTWRYACTLLGGSPDWINDNAVPLKEDRPIVLAGHISTAANTFSVSTQLRDHRLASRTTPSTLTPAAGETAGTVFAVEQWCPFSQPRSNVGQDEMASCPVTIRPHTTIVLEAPYNTAEYQVLATLGAGQNKCMNGSSEEQSIQLNGALTRGNDIYIVTRNVLQPEDISVHLGNSNASRQRYNVLFGGEASGKVEKLTPSTTLTTRKFGEATLFGLAVPSQYDGVTFGEQSVFDQPEITYLYSDSLGYEDIAYEKLTAYDTDKYYVFTVVTGFADHLGQLHRSAPSTPLWVAGYDPASLTDTDNHITLGVTTPVSAYGSAREYFAEVYMAIGEAAPQLAATKSISVSDGQGADSEIRFTNLVYNNNGQQEPIRWSEVLYTEGSVLPSDPWPAFDDFVITSNRLFAISAEIPGTVYYSKLLEENIAPEFSAGLVISLGRNRQLTGIGAIDDKILVFSEREIFAIYDTGPDNTGANGDFVVDRLQTTVGCTDPQSIVEIPDGLFFYSGTSKEFHLLSRDLQVHDIGKAVEDTAGAITNVKAAVVVPDEHEVRWYVDSSDQYEYGEWYYRDPYYSDPPSPAIPRWTNPLPAAPALVYNYYYKKWCVHSHSRASHAVLFQNFPCFIESDWDVFQASNLVEDWEKNTANKLTVRTPWIRVNQLQSYGRIERASILGKYLSSWRDFGNGNGTQAGDVNVRVRYDYEDFDEENYQYTDYLFRANAGELSGDLGNGARVPVGRMQFSIVPERQKCQAIQFEFSERASNAVGLHEPDYATGRGWVISGIDLEYSPKQGTGSKTMNTRTTK